MSMCGIPAYQEGAGTWVGTLRTVRRVIPYYVAHDIAKSDTNSDFFGLSVVMLSYLVQG